MTDFDNVFNDFQYSDKAEKSLKEFSNWIFAISIGISTLLIFQMLRFDLTKYYYSKQIYEVIIISSMLNVLLTGYNKYMILKRDTIMSIKYGSLKKTAIFSKLNDIRPEEIKEKWNTLFTEWTFEFNKIKIIGQILNVSIITTLIVIIVTGVFVMSVL